MSKESLKIPEIHNNDYNFGAVLNGLGRVRTVKDSTSFLKYPRTDYTNKLSFPNKPLKTGIHKIHPYPAMLHPLVVDFLIKQFCKKGDIIFDPFSGSGVSLHQAQLNGYNAFGYDINPLALLISKVKTAKYDIEKLRHSFELLEQDIKNNLDIEIPNIKNIDLWFANNIQNELGRIKWVLKNKKYEYHDLFVVCFALVCRTHSFTRSSEFKRYRVKEEKRQNYINKSPIENLQKHIQNMIQCIVSIPKNETHVEHFLKNSEDGIHQKYDFVLTSPPYGDSRTTVAYGEFCSFGIDWIGDINPFGKVEYRIDRESLGKKNIIDTDIYKNTILTDILSKIKNIDSKRVDDVMYFFNGYLKVLKNVVHNLNKNGTICFVVGNRMVKGYQVPMDQITAEFFEYLGLSFNSILIRNILNKVMPMKNSPTNKIGDKEKTMTQEYIVIFKKK